VCGVAYGLRVRAPWPLPELARAGGCADVVVRVTRRPMQHHDGDVRVSWPRIGTFVVRGGAEIVVTAASGVSRGLLRLYLLGPVFAALLHQRGYFLLHASAVSIGGRAVALLGDSLAGKSTAAAAFVQRGHGFLADDVVALSPSADGAVAVLPAFPQLKLWPDSAEALRLGSNLPCVCPGVDKRAVRVRARFVTQSQPIVCAYVLESGPSLAVEPLTAPAALFSLMRHTYGVRTFYATRARAHFSKCVAIARRLSLRRLSATPSLASVSDLVRAVEADLA